jgi:hypothetical protein
MQSAVPERDVLRAVRRNGVIAHEPPGANGAAWVVPAGLSRLSACTPPACTPPACCAVPAHLNV